MGGGGKDRPPSSDKNKGKGGKGKHFADPTYIDPRPNVTGPYSIVYGGVDDKESQTWWNGKWTTVIMPDGSSLRVKQGIPGGAFVRERVDGQWVDVELRKTVNGVSYNVADPAYSHAVEFVKHHPAGTVEAAERAKGVIGRDHRKGNTAPAPATSAAAGASRPPSTVNAAGHVVRDHRDEKHRGVGDVTKTLVNSKPPVAAGGGLAPTNRNNLRQAQ